MRATLVRMKPHQSVTISFRERSCNSIRNCASTLALDYPGRKYSVSVDRTAATCIVTRTA